MTAAKKIPPELIARAQARAALQARRAIEPGGLSLEEIVSGGELGALPASPVQRALMRAADGVPLGSLLADERVRFHFGCPANDVGQRRPRYVFVRGGVRSGKSLIAAIAMVLSAIRCTMRRPPDPSKGEEPGPDGLVGVRPGEFVRVVVVAPLLSLTRAAFTHVVSLIQQSKVLRPLLRSDPRKESITIVRPDGQEIEIQIVAASSAGATLRSTWLAGVLFDEADFHRDGEAVVNLEDNFKSIKARLLPGAQCWVVSSPWCEGSGFDEMIRGAWGRPGRELAFHSDSRSMNPTLDREEEAAERAKDPDNAAREYDAIPLSTASAEFFPPDVVKAAVAIGRGALAPNGLAHSAGGDLGFRRNSSAIAFSRFERGKVVLAFYQELRPTKSEPLKPSAVCETFAEQCHSYDARTILGDLHYADTAHEELAKHRSRSKRSPEPWTVTYSEYDTRETTESFTAFRRLMEEGRLELPDDPRLLAQIRATRRVVMPGGVVKVKLPKQNQAHGDVLVAVVLSAVQVEFTDEQAANDFDDLEDLLPPTRWGGQRGYG